MIAVVTLLNLYANIKILVKFVTHSAAADRELGHYVRWLSH